MNDLMKNIFICSLLFISACAQISLKKFERADTLTKYESVHEALEYLRKRDESLERLKEFAPNPYPQKSTWFTRFFSKSEGAVEEVIVTGIRASVAGAIEDSAAIESLMRVAEVSITNTQEASVDEGGIVKRKGDYLIALRKGKLYSVHIGSELRKVDEIDLQPESWEHDAWYDELLIYNNILLVIGYSYENESSEYVFFELDKEGKFNRKGAYLVNSGDYYSEDNYAGRLVGNNFIFYIEDFYYGIDSNSTFYDMNKLSPYTSKVDEFGKTSKPYPLFTEHKIYSPVLTTRDLQMTTVVVCPINIESFSCTATSILGAAMKSYYASADAFFFWMRGSEWNTEYADIPESMLKRFARSKSYERWSEEKYAAIYRIPFNGGNVGMVKIKGAPIDQFSFKQRGESLHIVGREALPDSGWFDADYDKGSTFATSIPLVEFELGVNSWLDSNYIVLEQDESQGTKKNRFIDDRLVYSSVQGDEYQSNIYVLDIKQPDTLTTLKAELVVEQLHPIGKNMLLVGYDQNDSTQYQTLSLENNVQIVDTLTESGGELAESRSHGFFYKRDDEGGVFAIPVFTEPQEASTEVEGEEIANMRYTRVTSDLTLHPAGVLEGDKAQPLQPEQDCEISCYDWYGSSRPIFWGDRIFALLKYELIEGVRSGDVIQEVRRIDIRND